MEESINSPFRKLPPSLSSYEPKWKLRYSSDSDDFVEDFFTPALARAQFYDRVVGYFTLGGLARIGSALEPFWDQGRKIRLVMSVEIPEKDLPTIEKAYEAVEQGLEITRPDFTSPLSLLTGFLVEERLEMYIATGFRDGQDALYHEKIGFIEDYDGNFLTFSGSPNETGRGLGFGDARGNIESFPVHRSWKEGERPHALAEREAIEGLFSDPPERNVKIYPFAEALEKNLIDAYPPRSPRGKSSPKNKRSSASSSSTSTPPSSKPDPEPKMPVNITLHDYQVEARNGWLDAGFRGRFEMATGTGKTITALATLLQVAQHSEAEEEPLLTIVLVPTTTLVEQWKEEAEAFGFTPIISGSAGWREKLNSSLGQLNFNLKPHVLLISTYSSAITQPANHNTLEYEIDTYKKMDQTGSKNKVFLIADEAHSMGAEGNQQMLLPHFDYRLGLSATFNRHYDEEGNEAISDFFAGYLTKISLRDAIYKYKTLVPYKYFPVLVNLTEEEVEKYQEITAEIGPLWATYKNTGFTSFEESAQMKLFERAAVLNHATGKIAALKEALVEIPSEEHKHMFIYTAEGDGPVYETRQDSQVKKVLDDLNIESKEFNGDTSLAARGLLQSDLARGIISALVAMKCLDEGVDVPEAKKAFFLASTTNPRQYVQRRGRILRKVRNNPDQKQFAELWDFFVVPPEVGPPGSDLWEMERKIVGRELVRALDLAEIAENKITAKNKLAYLVDYYGLHNLLPEEQ